MRNLTMMAAALMLAAPATGLAMGSRPAVDPPAQAENVPMSEYRALRVRHDCVRRVYDARTGEQRAAEGRTVDRVSTETDAARVAQKLKNRPAFNQHRANVASAIAELGYTC